MFNDFFTLRNTIIVVSLLFAGAMLVHALYRKYIRSIAPWKDLARGDPAPDVRASSEDHRKSVVRRSEDRLACAREAWRRGEPHAGAMIGRRRSDYEALGISFPDDKNNVS